MNKEEFFADNTTLALDGLDLKLKKYLPYSNGVFFEAGANDGMKFSNTYIFEKLFGWTGILVEPSTWYNDLAKNRPNSIHFNCALVSYNWGKTTINGNFLIPLGHTANLMSTTEESYKYDNKDISEVKAMTMEDVILSTNFKEFDLISLDCEGSEFSILNGFNFEKCSTKYFLIEISSGDDYEVFNKIFTLLKNKGYTLEDKLSVNDWLFKKIL